MEEVTIIKAATLPDHVHMYVPIPPKVSVSKVIGRIKGKSARMIFDSWNDAGYFLLKGMRKVDGEFFSYGKGAESRVVGQMPNMISRRNNCSAIRL